MWHEAGIFLLLLAAWQLLGACFQSQSARWGGVALLAAILGVPVAGTALALMDPYLTARSLSTPATLFAIAAFARAKPWRAGAWLLLTALVHPEMAHYGIVFAACLAYFSYRKTQPEVTPAMHMFTLPVLPVLLDLEPAFAERVRMPCGGGGRRDEQCQACHHFLCRNSDLS